VRDPVNTSAGQAAILRELDAVHSDIREDRLEVKEELVGARAELNAKLDLIVADQNRKFDAVIAEQKITNGRVRQLEIAVKAFRYLGVVFIAMTPFAVWFLNTQ
jgi:hypothetical protein